MNKIITKAKQMTLFQKILLISAIVPYYSSGIVNIVTYFVYWKKKLSFFPFVICFFAYGILMFLVYDRVAEPVVKYIISCLIALVGNCCMICIQMRE